MFCPEIAILHNAGLSPGGQDSPLWVLEALNRLSSAGFGSPEQGTAKCTNDRALEVV